MASGTYGGFRGTGYGDTHLAGKRGSGGLVEDENVMPKYNQGRIAGLTQEQMAPALSTLRRQFAKVRSGRYSTPTARASALRAGTRGIGEGLAPLYAQASRTARGLYQPEYEREVAEWKRGQMEREREEEMERERDIRRATPIGGGDSYRSAYDRMEAYDPFGAKARFAERPFAPAQESITYGASPQEREAIERKAMATQTTSSDWWG